MSNDSGDRTITVTITGTSKPFKWTLVADKHAHGTGEALKKLQNGTITYVMDADTASKYTFTKYEISENSPITYKSNTDTSYVFYDDWASSPNTTTTITLHARYGKTEAVDPNSPTVENCDNDEGKTPE